jgi:hypothetical protein
MSPLSADRPRPARLTRQEILSAATQLLAPMGLDAVEAGTDTTTRAVKVAIRIADEVDKQLHARK